MGENGKGGTRKLCHQGPEGVVLQAILRHLFRVGAYDASRGYGLRGPVATGMNAYSVGSSTECSYFSDMPSDQWPVCVKSGEGDQASHISMGNLVTWLNIKPIT